ncbi:MAG: DNA helicase II, partial [Gammaproteobacteria bacterium]|nr:DNA helicase II [Gammaproteobacteria bacterium]
EAVTAPPGPVLVLAGAGSGKTRVLVHRAAWLIGVERVSPWGMLAVTFTNKAAAEMRGRLQELLGVPAAGMWIGTFHGLSHRLLRAHWREAGLPEAFQILDAEDQQRVVRRVLRSLELDEARWPPKEVQRFINARKDEALRPARVDHRGDPYVQQLVRVYRAYEEHCARAGLVDFAELLLRTLELWHGHPQLLAHYRERFRHILVDEFQDTNAVQYDWLKLLAGHSGQVFAVGDDDQSIYGWRGARVENLKRLTDEFPATRIVRLEQNYRSTSTILRAANAVIAYNQGRMGKSLWTAGEPGEPLELYSAFNEQDEARYVVGRISAWIEHGGAPNEVAVLYRSNAQSRAFEEALIMSAIPYRVYGGLRFFERAEIKDALAYLRLAANRDDDASFERIVNQPARGIGERTLAAVRERARHEDSSLWHAARLLVAEGATATRAAKALQGFLERIDRIASRMRGLPLHEQVDQALGESGLLEHYKADRSEKGRARVENLEELVNAAQSFAHEGELPPEAEGLDPLAAFLAHAALEAGEAQGDPGQPCVQLMTLHAAKGLEFSLVFLCGMEEGLFPHQLALEESGRLEEERRLCYVGLTRGRRHVVLSYAERRRLHGAETFPHPSRFLYELPQELLHEVRPRVTVARPASPAGADTDVDHAPGLPGALHLGQRVAHPKFGEGVVLNYEGKGSHARVQVNFEHAGSKWLVVAYANLEPV